MEHTIDLINQLTDYFDEEVGTYVMDFPRWFDTYREYIIYREYINLDVDGLARLLLDTKLVFENNMQKGYHEVYCRGLHQDLGISISV